MAEGDRIGYYSNNGESNGQESGEQRLFARGRGLGLTVYEPCTLATWRVSRTQ